MDKIIIRRLSADDIEMLQNISVNTFIDTYAGHNTAENMQHYLQQHFSREQLLTELINGNNYFFAAFDNDIPAGYTKLRTFENPEQLPGRKHIELERIYTVKKYQGMGLGHRMMQYSLDFASVKGYELLWLGVWEHNEKALKFYTKFGFEIFGEHTFTLGSEEQTDWLMKKELSPA
ncbi:GNAT family N-acetyltransferase [Panacibacter ginsenosidivorans]|uniref:GNAT family N-acetyltransferase n=1 Tax=Panacibacter ginsenosidivorans TaxID=1813871 RepID=A0A5B8V4I2_9BACT|nr:N-acetyltransferase [Panacibacter ginsenosidivorans]QEC66294.1 GNAT family N-acetyltransferase [Panacibacter ginsenosidivorans]